MTSEEALRVLNLSVTATADDVRSAYDAMLRQEFPELWSADEQSRQLIAKRRKRLEEINDAFSTLIEQLEARHDCGEGPLYMPFQPPYRDVVRVSTVVFADSPPVVQPQRNRPFALPTDWRSNAPGLWGSLPPKWMRRPEPNYGKTSLDWNTSHAPTELTRAAVAEWIRWALCPNGLPELQRQAIERAQRLWEDASTLSNLLKLSGINAPLGCPAVWNDTSVRIALAGLRAELLKVGSPVDEGPIPKDLTPSEKRALEQYICAERESNCMTDNAAYQWLINEDLQLPKLPTWKRHLRNARRKTGTSKRPPRQGRTGRSIVGPEEK